MSKDHNEVEITSRATGRPRDMVRFLEGQDLSEAAVMGLSVAEAKQEWARVRASVGLKGSPKLLTPPNGSAKAEHGLTDVKPAATWMLYLLPADSSGAWQVCRYATAGCRQACLVEAGQQGMETRAGRKATGHIARGRLARTLFLGENPQAFFRLIVAELDVLPNSMWAKKGFALGWRPNGTADVPFEQLGLDWLYRRVLASGVQPYDYTAWPSNRRDRATSLVYIVDSVKETHSDDDIKAMARPVVVFDVKRNGKLPETFLGRRVVSADKSDARWLDDEGTVRGLTYKHVASCSKDQAIASGFVRCA